MRSLIFLFQHLCMLCTIATYRAVCCNSKHDVFFKITHFTKYLSERQYKKSTLFIKKRALGLCQIEIFGYLYG